LATCSAIHSRFFCAVSLLSPSIGGFKNAKVVVEKSLAVLAQVQVEESCDFRAYFFSEWTYAELNVVVFSMDFERAEIFGFYVG
jgi:allophanate hydrolase subunit 2